VQVDRRIAAFLRGVNVGGNQKLDMPTLRQLLGDLGFSDVRTYLQSGNAVFSYGASKQDELATRIEGAIEKQFGFAPRVLLRTAAQLDEAIASDPLIDVATDPSKHLVGFLIDSPSASAAKQAEAQSSGNDLIRVVGSHLYMWCPGGVSRSPLFKVNFDKLLGTTVSMRNWNTVMKVAGLLRP
jgi:uncharacterized protein (DUF1697 family)